MEHNPPGFHGPKMWVISLLAGALVGVLVSFIAPAAYPAAEAGAHEVAPTIPAWLLAPFVLMLASIALMPFINARFWHHYFPDVAFFLSGIILAYYLRAFNQPYHGYTYGQYKLLHVAHEYIAFIALIGGLYVASGGIAIRVTGQGKSAVNVALLAFGAVFANIVGTTGASVLLIRPFMRINQGRLTPLHVVFFIFIVSNCGGCLTPIGDPPLYLGYLQGVPFEWTFLNLLPQWGTAVGLLLAIFYAFDRTIGAAQEPAPTRIAIRGFRNIFLVMLIVAGVFIDPFLHSRGFAGIPVGPMFQVIVAVVAYLTADRDVLDENDFTFFPVKEVGLLFVGIFITMAPALAFLESHGREFGLNSPGKFYFATGALSAVLDNAPTYLNFLQIAFAAQGLPLNPDNVHAFLATDMGRHELAAISLGAVFFGAMTYIGNGPNFMVKSIAEASGLKMPSFFGYLKYAALFLLPVLVVVWAIWIR